MHAVGAIAVAALSARLLAQAGAQAGLQTIALDVFGDRDTRAAAARWLPIGTPDALRIDAALLLDTLAALARGGAVQGWTPGAGFEGRPELLEQGAALLPLLGTSGADVRRLRDPKTFFDALDALRIKHPEVRHESVAGAPGWLMKDFGASGATHIRPASADHPTALRYLQRVAPGSPMSATFIANGREALLLGCNQQIVRPFDDLPYRFHGVIGPVVLPAAVRAQVQWVIDALSANFRLRGLASLDFLLDADQLSVLEVNPRAPASMALYPRVGKLALFHAHLLGCGGAALPEIAQPAQPTEGARIGVSMGTTAEVPHVRGTEIVFAAQPLRLDDAALAALASSPATHDLPHRAAPRADAPHFGRGEAVCSVSASGADAAAVSRELARRRDAVLHLLQTPETCR